MGIRTLRLALIAAAMAAATPALAQQTSVRAGVEAWQQGNHEEAVRQWRPLADRGDPDAQYNLAQAYKLGRGVPLNMTLAEQWYERAARQGHEQAGANLGLILFQNGRRREAMPYVERARAAGDRGGNMSRHGALQRRRGGAGLAARLCPDEPGRG